MSADCQLIISAVNESGAELLREIIPEKQVDEIDKPEDGNVIYTYTLDLSPLIYGMQTFLVSNAKVHKVTEFITQHPDAVDTLPSLDKVLDTLEESVHFLEATIALLHAARQAVYCCRSVKQLIGMIEKQVGDWRVLSMATLEISGDLLHKLAHHHLITLGGLAEYCQSGRTILSLEFINPDDERVLAAALRTFLRRARGC